MPSYSPYPPHQQAWPMLSPNSDVLLESQLEQIRSLGRIEEAVKPIPDMRNRIEGNTIRIARLETKLDDHIQDCRKPRGASSWIKDLSKENWSWIVAILVLVLSLLGQPQAAERLSSASPRSDWSDLSR